MTAKIIRRKGKDTKLFYVLFTVFVPLWQQELQNDILQ